MSMKVGELVAYLGVNDSEYYRKLGQAETRAHKVGAAITKIAAAASLAAGILIVKSLRTYDTFGQSIDTLTRLTGMSTEAASQFTGQWKRFGIDSQAGLVATRFLAKNLDAAQQGTKAMSDVFKRLHISLKDSNGQLRQVGDVLPEVRDKLSALNNSGERTALTLKLFGRGGANMLKWLTQSKSSIAGVNKELLDLGMVWGDKQLKTWKDLKDAQREMGLQWTALQLNLASALIPALRTLMGWIETGIKDWNNLSDATKGWILKATAVVGILGLIGPKALAAAAGLRMLGAATAIKGAAGMMAAGGGAGGVASGALPYAMQLGGRVAAGAVASGAAGASMSPLTVGAMFLAPIIIGAIVEGFSRNAKLAAQRTDLLKQTGASAAAIRKSGQYVTHIGKGAGTQTSEQIQRDIDRLTAARDLMVKTQGTADFIASQAVQVSNALSGVQTKYNATVKGLSERLSAAMIASGGKITPEITKLENEIADLHAKAEFHKNALDKIFKAGIMPQQLVHTTVTQMAVMRAQLIAQLDITGKAADKILRSIFGKRYTLHSPKIPPMPLTQAQKDLQTLAKLYASGATKAGDRFATAMVNEGEAGSVAGAKLGAAALNGLKGKTGEARAVGESFAYGLANGISSPAAALVADAAASHLVHSALGAARAAARSNSPSKATMEIGRNLAEGLALGMRRAVHIPIAASADMMRGTLQGARGMSPALAGAGAGGDIHVHIHSPGGAVIQGNARQLAEQLAPPIRTALERLAAQNARHR